METMIVFFHLRLDFVYQRPQHLLSMLLEHYNALFLKSGSFWFSSLDARGFTTESDAGRGKSIARAELTTDHGKIAETNAKSPNCKAS